MSDLISRKILIDEVYQMNGNRYVKETIVNVIREQPTIKPEQTEPPEAERINPSAREMIEAEIAQIRENIEPDEMEVSERQFAEIRGLEFALECLDKPAEPMVSIKAVRDANL